MCVLDRVATIGPAAELNIFDGQIGPMKQMIDDATTDARAVDKNALDPVLLAELK